jgi:uncharacterized OB-fold protein
MTQGDSSMNERRGPPGGSPPGGGPPGGRAGGGPPGSRPPGGGPPGGGPPGGGPPPQKPIPTVTDDTKPFFDYARKHELRMQKCLRCGKFYYPPSEMCPHCHNWGAEWTKLSGKGEVYSFIVARRATNPAFAREIPYVVAIILTEEGTRMISNVVGVKPEDVRVGMPVEVAFEDLTDTIALPKFKPVAA